MYVALTLHLCHLAFHLLSIVTMESVTFDERVGHSFTAKDFFKGGPHSAGASTRGAGDYNYGVLFGQVLPLLQVGTDSLTFSHALVTHIHVRSPGHVLVQRIRSLPS
jgi:hypothetical protein